MRVCMHPGRNNVINYCAALLIFQDSRCHPNHWYSADSIHRTSAAILDARESALCIRIVTVRTKR